MFLDRDADVRASSDCVTLALGMCDFAAQNDEILLLDESWDTRMHLGREQDSTSSLDLNAAASTGREEREEGSDSAMLYSGENRSPKHGAAAEGAGAWDDELELVNRRHDISIYLSMNSL